MNSKRRALKNYGGVSYNGLVRGTKMTEDLNLEYYNRLREYLPLDGQTKFGKDFEQDLDEALKNGFDIKLSL